MTITITTAYGPQESSNCETKQSFWKYLHHEAQRANTNGKGFILQGDLNSWLGPNLLPGDSHSQNKNGKHFSEFLCENHLTCVNSLPITQGLITRSRKCLNEVNTFFCLSTKISPELRPMLYISPILTILEIFASTQQLRQRHQFKTFVRSVALGELG